MLSTITTLTPISGNTTWPSPPPHASSPPPASLDPAVLTLQAHSLSIPPHEFSFDAVFTGYDISKKELSFQSHILRAIFVPLLNCCLFLNTSLFTPSLSPPLTPCANTSLFAPPHPLLPDSSSAVEHHSSRLCQVQPRPRPSFVSI
jgi:hypothetical protein